MKPFLLFTGSKYYPSGGWKDYRSEHDTEREALTAAANAGDDWWQIVSTENFFKIVNEGTTEIYR